VNVLQQLAQVLEPARTHPDSSYVASLHAKGSLNKIWKKGWRGVHLRPWLASQRREHSGTTTLIGETPDLVPTLW